MNYTIKHASISYTMYVYYVLHVLVTIVLQSENQINASASWNALKRYIKTKKVIKLTISRAQSMQMLTWHENTVISLIYNIQ